MDYRKAEDEIRRHLDTDEKLLWSGKPAQGIKFRPQDVFLIPFSLMWGGFAIMWEIIALTSFIASGAAKETFGFVLIFPLFGIPFVLVGLYLIFGRFIVDARQREKTFYGVTDDRIVIVSGLFSQRIKSLNLKTLTDISMNEKGNGSGSITFGPSNPLLGIFAGTSWPMMGRNIPPGFDMLENVAEVYRIIRNAQKK